MGGDGARGAKRQSRGRYERIERRQPDLLRAGRHERARSRCHDWRCAADGRGGLARSSRADRGPRRAIRTPTLDLLPGSRGSRECRPSARAALQAWRARGDLGRELTGVVLRPIRRRTRGPHPRHGQSLLPGRRARLCPQAVARMRHSRAGPLPRARPALHGRRSARDAAGLTRSDSSFVLGRIRERAASGRGRCRRFSPGTSRRSSTPPEPPARRRAQGSPIAISPTTAASTPGRSARGKRMSG